MNIDLIPCSFKNLISIITFFKYFLFLKRDTLLFPKYNFQLSNAIK